MPAPASASEPETAPPAPDLDALMDRLDRLTDEMRRRTVGLGARRRVGAGEQSGSERR